MTIFGININYKYYRNYRYTMELTKEEMKKNLELSEKILESYDDISDVGVLD